jgi:hypothetical protein
MAAMLKEEDVDPASIGSGLASLEGRMLAHRRQDRYTARLGQ